MKRSSLLQCLIGALFAFDLTWEYGSVDIFPDYIFPSLAFISVCFLAIKKAYKVDSMFLALVGALAVNIVAGIFEARANTQYFDEYNLASVLKISKAEDMYSVVVLGAVVSAIALALSVFVVLMFIKMNARKTILDNTSLFSETDIDYFVKEFDKKTNRLSIITLSIVVLSGIINVLMVAFRPYTDWFVLIDIVLKVAFIFAFIITVLNVHDDVYKRISIFA